MTPSNRSADRRGALLLLVLSMLTLFVIIGGLMLTLATRTRVAARAFADATATASAGALQSKGVLDEALMVLLRGAKNDTDLPQPLRGQSILEDRYGTGTTTGEAPAGGVTFLTMGAFQNYKPILQASIQNLSPAVTHPCELNGRIITFKPDPDDGEVASYRILRTTGQAQPFTVFLANTPTNKSAVLPKKRCAVFINGPEFLDEPHDSFDTDPWLTRVELRDSRISKVLQCTYGAAPACDNDNDGVPDGVWLSGVIPDRPSPRGGTLKYELSYLVLDLDGRINFNAHGSLAATQAAASWPGTVAGVAVGTVPVGLGYGPADVDASRLLAGGPNATAVPGFPSTRWTNIVIGSTAPPTQTVADANQRRPAPTLGALATTPVEGRYGTDKTPGTGAALPVLQQLAVAGRLSTDPLRSATDLQTLTRGFLQPPAGNAGVPTLTFFTPSNAVNDLQRSPYDLRLDSDAPRSAAIRSAIGDNPFTVAELERILRQFDADASFLPQRLATLLDGYAERSRMTVTTDSWDTPALTGAILRTVRDYMKQFPAPTAPTRIAAGSAEVYDTLSPDVTAGLRFDINRPLEHPSVPLGQRSGVKDRYCQHLYTLLVAIGLPAGAETAQWVANVCDFRDVDSTMTRFQIDDIIIDGWAPAAGATTVFGAERPDVVITETVGWSGKLFVTLHHPWKAIRLDTGNAPVDAEVVDPALGANNTVELAKKSGDESIWRLRIDGRPAVSLSDATAAQGVSVLAANTYAVVGSDNSCYGDPANPALPPAPLQKIPNVLTSAALVPSAPEGIVILERLADPTMPSGPDNPYVPVDQAPYKIAQDQGSAEKQRRSPVSFWKQAWAACGPTDKVPATYPSVTPWFHWPNRPFVSAAELALVPKGKANDMLANFAVPSVGTPLPNPVADPATGILDAVHVRSRFATTELPFGGQNDVLTPLFVNERIASNAIPRWREPGRVNVNTISPNTGNSVAVLDDAVWKATVGDSGPQTNPFAANAANTLTKVIALGAAGGAPYIETPAAPRDGDSFFNYATANRIANVGTIRSHVFAVWITLKTTDTSAGGPGETYDRMFAIVDRSIPVGFSKGANLNVRDTIRLQRFLE